MNRKQKILNWTALILLIAFTVFLLYQAALSGEESSAVSGGVGAWLERPLSALFPDPEGLGRPIGEWWSGYESFIRKFLGHFCGFVLEGLLAAGTAAAWLRGKARFFAPPAFGFVLALCTELLQLDLVNAGRTFSASDIALDFSGFLLGGIVLWLVRFLWLRFGKKS